MENSIITTGKSIDLAIAAALKQLNMDRDSVSVEVLENARSGFLGIGASPAKVKVTYEVPDAPQAPQAPKSALGAASRSKPAKPAAPAAPAATAVISRPGKKPVEQPKEEKPARARNERSESRPTERKPQSARPAEKKPEKPARPAEKPAEQPRPVKAEQQPRPARAEQPRPATRRPAQPAEPMAPARSYAPAAPGSVEEQIEIFLKGLLEHMGSDAVPHAYRMDEESYRADLVGSDAGLLIGRRGDTLDAIQYITGYAINRERENRLRISVDAGDYRLKREEALRALAQKMAAKAVKYHRNFTLEPMNAYERHVIHAALQDYDEVTTFSTGSEPHRRIVVAYSREK